jgi:hypothetical protein
MQGYNKNMPIILNGDGPISGITSVNASVSATELGYLDGVTSGLQNQINNSGGLVKITNQTFSSVSTVSVNNCFSSSYQNYSIMINASCSNELGLRLRMRSGGTDANGSDYKWQYLSVSGGSVGASRFTSETSAVLCDFSSSGSISLCNTLMFSPFESKHTAMRSISADPRSSVVIQDNANYHSQNISYDGFTIFISSGNMTGTVRVYGYRD